MTTRERLVEIASSYVGSNDRAGFWQRALGYDPGKSKAWCGAFYLACLKEAGLTDIKWGIDGTGIQSLHLPRTTHPEPGDLGYQGEPFQHHFVVEHVDTHTLSSIDGNQGTPGVQRRSRAVGNPKLAFFSISKLLVLAADPDADTQPDVMPPAWRRVLRIGSTGPDVSRLQSALNIGADGVYGPRTEAAVKTFQRQHGLGVDGIAGAVTQSVLYGDK